MNQLPIRPQPRALRRAQKERLLFGVCGGLGAYFNIDPTVVRVGFVIAGLIPPLGGLLVAAYAILVFLIPVEGTDELTGREQVKDNLAGLRSEVAGLAETVRERITGEPRAATPHAADTADATEPTETKPAA